MIVPIKVKAVKYGVGSTMSEAKTFLSHKIEGERNEVSRNCEERPTI